MFLLRGLVPGTMYEVMVCRPRFNIRGIPPLTPSGTTRFIAECGYCTACYTTEEAFYDFDMTTVTRINDTHVQLVCDVMSNIPQFFINWSISDPENVSERLILDNGDVVDELPVSVINERQGSNGYMSTLIAPETILERDVLCTANSTDYRSQSSESGAFELFEGIITASYKLMDFVACSVTLKNIVYARFYIKLAIVSLLADEPQSTNNFPVWAMIIVAVVCLLTLICLIVAAALIVGLVCSCSRTRKRKFEPTEIQRLAAVKIASYSGYVLKSLNRLRLDCICTQYCLNVDQILMHLR